MTDNWRKPSRVVYDELMALSNATPITPEKMRDLAPFLTTRAGSPERALMKLRETLEGNPHLKEFSAASAALGFNPRLTATSKQQRLSDLAPYYDRVGWRNMFRWMEAGFDRIAEMLSGERLWSRLFEVELLGRDGHYDLEVFYFKPEPEEETVLRVTIGIGSDIEVEWEPADDDSIIFRRLPLVMDQSTKGCWVSVGWFGRAHGRVDTFVTPLAGWRVEQRVDERQARLWVSEA